MKGTAAKQSDQGDYKFDMEGNLVADEGETEEARALREAQMLYQEGHSLNHPDVVEAQYVEPEPPDPEVMEGESQEDYDNRVEQQRNEHKERQEQRRNERNEQLEKEKSEREERIAARRGDNEEADQQGEDQEQYDEEVENQARKDRDKDDDSVNSKATRARRSRRE